MHLTPFTNPIGTAFIELQSIDSTNNYALGRVHDGMAQHGECYFSFDQTAGKGQRGKRWATEAGANIIMSVVLKPNFLQIFQQFRLSACVAVATRQFLEKYVDEVKIKWPNDIYWKDRKAGGILIENIIGKLENDEISPVSQSSFRKDQTSILKWSVAGIGININQTEFPPDLPNPVSLKQITGREFDAIALAKELCSSLDHYYHKLATGEFDLLLSLYNEALYKKDQKVKLKAGNRIFETTIKRVDEYGQLVTSNSIEEKFDSGEITWL